MYDHSISICIGGKTMPANASTTTSGGKVTKIGKKKCKPFVIQVMVFIPEAGFKFELAVERACTASNDSIWKLVFDLYRQKASGDGFDQLVHVSYTGQADAENSGIINTLKGVNEKQVKELVNKTTPSAKAFFDDPSEDNQGAVVTSMRRVALAGQS
jgi:hypothetical protein